MSAGQIIVFPHERFDALETYRSHLTEEQINSFDDAPESALICLSFNVGEPGWKLSIIEEG